MTLLNLIENSILYKIREVILIVATNMSADFRHFSQTCHFAQQLCTPLYKVSLTHEYGHGFYFEPPPK